MRKKITYEEFCQINNLVPDTEMKQKAKQELSVNISKTSNQIKFSSEKEFYDYNSMEIFQGLKEPELNPLVALKTLDELLERDKQREDDGFPRRIRLGKIVKPGKGSKSKVVIVPTTNEPKFYHDNSVTEDGEGKATGGSGEGEEGEVLGEQQAEPEEGEGEGQGAGQGQGASHDVSNEAFDLGKVLTEKFKLPNLKVKGTKRSLTKFKYDLTDRNRGFGQLLDKKQTIKRIVKTNIQLGRINPGEPVDTSELLINPDDQVFRILSKEKDFESQAVVFFVRDYSGSMDGKPTEAIATQHLFIYSWLMYQYKNNVTSRFVLHDTEAKEVEDFYTYYRSRVAGGTQVAPAFELVNKIVEDERLEVDNNIYVFYGTDGDDWDSKGDKFIEALRKMLTYSSRTGITIARNSWTSSTAKTTVEKHLEKSKFLEKKRNLIRKDSFSAAEANEGRIIQSIKDLCSE